MKRRFTFSDALMSIAKRAFEKRILSCLLCLSCLFLLPPNVFTSSVFLSLRAIIDGKYHDIRLIRISFCKYLKVFDYLRTDVEDTVGINIETILLPFFRSNFFLHAITAIAFTVDVFLTKKNESLVSPSWKEIAKTKPLLLRRKQRVKTGGKEKER